MPRFLPFPGIRYGSRDISAVSAPPYDVIEPEARAALAARDPHNAVRLILPDAYDAAAAALATWRDEGVLNADTAPTFSIYRMDFTGDDGIPQRTTGVLGALALDDDGSGVMPHERTLPKAKTDRLELLRATRANLDPIWGLSLAGGLSSHLSPGDAEPVLRAWPVRIPQGAKIMRDAGVVPDLEPDSFAALAGRCAAFRVEAV